MKVKLVTPLFGLLCGLLASAVLLTPTLWQSDTVSRVVDTAPGESLLHTDVPSNAAAPAQPVPVPSQRRQRATLSMPYFSFAQSLRPRG